MSRKRLGLVGELTMAQLLYSVVLASAMASLLYHQLTTTLQESFRSRVATSTQDLAQSISLYVAYRDPTGIPDDELMARLLGRGDTAYVRVLDQVGSILFERAGPAGGERLLDGARRGTATSLRTDVRAPGLLEVAAPVMAATSGGPSGAREAEELPDWTGLHPSPEAVVRAPVGTLIVGYRLDDLLEGQHMALVRALALALGILVVGVGFSVLLGRSIGGSLALLSRRAEALARGEMPKEPIPEEGRGEIEELCRAFNIMTRAVEEREDQLEHERQKLEREVEARTRELRAEALRLENANDLLTLQNTRVKAADRTKSEFLATISHELRTPLNSIIGFSDLLLQEVQGPLEAAQREDLATVHEAAQHLLELINDLLDLSKVEAGRMETHPTTVEPEDLVGRLRAMAQGLPVHDGVTLDVSVAPDTPAPWADPKRLHQVVLNLVSNALKFTTEGRVDVLLDAGEDGGFRLRVRDTGPGIPEEQQEHIFQPFGQVDQTAARQRQGTGLGLTISRQLVELMGGTLTLESAPGSGSTFTLRIPSARGEAPEDAPRGERP